MARPSKHREIQVQKPAQSLAHFQSKLGRDHEESVGLMKPILIGAGAVVALCLAAGVWWTQREQAIEKHEEALARIEQAVEGDGLAPVAPAEAEARMRQHLPELEALAKAAPASRKAITEGLLASWKLSLDGKAPEMPMGGDAWSRLELARRALALGQVQAARQQLDPLRGEAKPGEAWAGVYWSSVLEADRLAGDRAQAWKDLAEYKARYKGRSESGAMDNLMQSI